VRGLAAYLRDAKSEQARTHLQDAVKLDPGASVVRVCECGACVRVVVCASGVCVRVCGACVRVVVVVYSGVISDRGKSSVTPQRRGQNPHHTPHEHFPPVKV
jgi:hypothetical protein